MTRSSAHPHVRVTDDAGWLAATRLALADHYGLTVTHAARLGGEVDVNVAVTCDGGQRVVVKLGPPDADPQHVQWQHTLLTALSRRQGLPPVPQIVPADDGSLVVTVESDGGVYPVRVQTWLPGRMLADLNRHSDRLLADWGAAAAQLCLALPKVEPSSFRPESHHWELARAAESVSLTVDAVIDPDRRRDVDTVMTWFDELVTPVLDGLPRQVVHQDLNDFNVLALPDAQGLHRLSGVLDFSDALHTVRVSELAIAVAYAMLRKPEPLAAAAQVVRGFTEVAPLTDAELRAVFPLAAARLCVNATTWTARQAANGEYARARMANTWPTLHQLARTPPSLAEQWFRAVAGVGGRSPAAVVTTALAGRSAATDSPGLGHGHLLPAGPPQRRRTRDGAPSTLALGVTVDRVQPPDGAVVEVDDSRTLLVRWDDVPGGVWARWTRDEADTRLCLFAARDAALLAPRGRVTPASALAWRRLCPDPALLYGGGASCEQPDVGQVRAAHVAGAQRHYYSRPPVLVGSEDVWLVDDAGLAYLDAINNVTHVGHANPTVVSALHRQAQRLNTNSRFLYPELGQYAARLADLLPDPLDVVFLVCSGSEANDLALRIARQVTGRVDVAVIDGAYHGNTAAVTGVSPNRYRGPGGAGRPATTHELPLPDLLRGPYRYGDPAAGQRYAADAGAVIEGMVTSGRVPAAVIAESLMGSAGCIVHPPGYLAGVFAAARRAGGLTISDEVQVGFGRLGSSFWGFQRHGVVPDIVTLGKPIGNGHPLAAVVTTRAVAEAFDTGMKYFNTFGGNPVSCAVGMAVLDEIENRGLPANAADVGGHLRDRLSAIGHPMIADVRGEGLYLGVELVDDRGAPDAARARTVSDLMKDEGVIVGHSGVHDNVLKIKPPMTFTREHADLYCAVLSGVLSDDW